jgi:hypothetical protein
MSLNRGHARGRAAGCDVSQSFGNGSVQGQEAQCATEPQGSDCWGRDSNIILPNYEVKVAVVTWVQLFASYRVLVARNDEIIQGVLYPGLDPEHPVVRELLAGWPGSYYAHSGPLGVELTLIRPVTPRPRERWGLAAVLLLAAVLTTTVSGALFAGVDPLGLHPTALFDLGIPVPSHLDLRALAVGLWFSLPLIAVLLGHEMGHYVLARRHRLETSPPYFLPAPFWINIVGTFGAFIRLRSPLVNRAVLLDVGAGGPIMSFLLSVPLLALGLAWSRPLPMAAETAPTSLLLLFGQQPIWLGESLVLWALRTAFAADGVLLLHPFAVAGWIGMFVTMLNMFPVTQLDGGHILYALVGPRQRHFGLLFLLLLVALGGLWQGWWFWTLLVLLIGRGRVAHPPVLDPDYPLTPLRRQIGWACFAIFVLTFVPAPIVL